jgi:transposase InsO family protein
MVDTCLSFIMPFSEVSVIDQRRLLVSLVLEGGLPVTHAAAKMGVSRQTAHRWLNRAKQEGIDSMDSRSKAPNSRPATTAPGIVQQLVEAKLTHPKWGAKKHLQILWPEGAPIALRTADRILKREGLVAHRGKADRPLALTRFEKSACNEMWQMDFKGVSRSAPYKPLSLLDDHSRFALRLTPMTSMTWDSVFAVLWEAFAEFGLPQAILCDNGDCWGGVAGAGPNRIECRLMLLGVRLVHGRPRHPQTQGKVERFHGTIQYELGPAVVQPTVADAQRVFDAFRLQYNWVRPHEGIGMKTPGSVYERSAVPRPCRVPCHEIPSGSLVRAVDQSGKIILNNVRYRVGSGLYGQSVILLEDHFGRYAQFAGHNIGYLEHKKA